ncbi:MAG TPA: hypothetical protein VNF74_07835, partial [Terriglobales bacterium]|nr:hypothetical protein [Terriglobales bacterium]
GERQRHPPGGDGAAGTQRVARSRHVGELARPGRAAALLEQVDRFLRPVRPGDSITLTAAVTGITKVTNGGRVAVQGTATNQKGDTTAVGMGACIVPSHCVPEED